MRGIRDFLKTSNQSSRGFTLIEMAIVMIIFGVMVTSFSHLYRQYVDFKEDQTTQNNVEILSGSVGAFRSQYGRYPCPASLTETRGSDEYGHETDCEDTSIAVGDCDEGICIEESLRTVDTITPRVRVGFIPFKALNMQEEDAYDGYGNRLMYVVTERLAVDETFDGDHGGIDIQNEAGESLLDPPASSHFLIFSYGKNEAGAYNAQGQRLACPAAGHELENCNVEDEAVYKLAQFSSSDDANQFDDVFAFFMQDEVPVWQASETNALDIHQKNPGAVGVKVNADTELDDESYVGGIVRVVDDPTTDDNNPLTTDDLEGRIKVENVCSFGGTECFPSSRIAGNLEKGGGMECEDPGTYMVGIAENEPICKDEIIIRCPDDQLLVGINADGTLNCDAPPPVGCGNEMVTLCEEDWALPPRDHGEEFTIGPAGTTGEKYQTFLCDDGTWVSQGTTGVCTCEEETETFTDIPCGSGFTGTFDIERHYICPEGYWTGWDIINNECECIEVVETDSQSCPPGHSGSILLAREHVCDDPPYWTDWEEIENTCVCEPDYQDRWIPCGGGLQGQIHEERFFECPDAEWTPWQYIEDTCTCEPTTQQQQFACPPDHTGYLLKERDFLCPEAVWTDWVLVEDNCEPDPPVVCTWNSTGTAQIQGFMTPPAVGSQCECGAQPVPCSRMLDPFTYQYYDVCICE